jgi:fucose permease
MKDKTFYRGGLTICLLAGLVHMIASGVLVITGGEGNEYHLIVGLLFLILHGVESRS